VTNSKVANDNDPPAEHQGQPMILTPGAPVATLCGSQGTRRSRGCFLGGGVDAQELRENLKSGPIGLAAHLERLLAKIWDDLGGEAGGMVGHKLIGSKEHVEWHPPFLTFQTTITRGLSSIATTRTQDRWSVKFAH
jgi:hypothetical protein